MGLYQEFKDFAIKGNAIDMAVGIVIGAAFGGIVSSLVKDIILQPIAFATSGLDFSALVLKINNKPLINYGLFINAIINFLIVAFAIFILVKQINRLKKAPPAAPTTKTCDYCQSTIALKATRCPNCTSQLEPAKSVAP